MMEWMYGMYLSTMNSVYKNDLGRYSWSRIEFINDVWLDVFIWSIPRILWQVRVLSIMNHFCIHSFRSTTDWSYWKVKTVIWLFSWGWGHFNSFSSPRREGFEQKFFKNWMSWGLPGGVGGGNVEPLIWLVIIRKYVLNLYWHGNF